jgi:hypothetical protein
LGSGVDECNDRLYTSEFCHESWLTSSHRFRRRSLIVLGTTKGRIAEDEIFPLVAMGTCNLHEELTTRAKERTVAKGFLLTRSLADECDFRGGRPLRWDEGAIAIERTLLALS